MDFIQTETIDDFEEVEGLYDAAFGVARGALSSYQLRHDVAPVQALCRLIREPIALGGTICAAIRYWPIYVGTDTALLLGPIATHPTRQGEGLAAQLIWDSLRLAQDTGWQRVLLIGDLPYYQRFGFSREAALMVKFPPPTNPDRVLGLILSKQAMPLMKGTVRRWES